MYIVKDKIRNKEMLSQLIAAHQKTLKVTEVKCKIQL